MIRLFLSPAGRSTRREFWIGVAGFVAFCWLFSYVLNYLVTSMLGFWLTLILIVLFFQIMYGVYGKRLHDIGRSYWPLTGMIALIFCVGIAIMIYFGAGEMMAEYAQYDRKADIPQSEKDRITSTYQENMEGAENVYRYSIFGLWGAFTLWLGIAKPDPNENRYGKPLIES